MQHCFSYNITLFTDSLTFEQAWVSFTIACSSCIVMQKLMHNFQRFFFRKHCSFYRYCASFFHLMIPRHKYNETLNVCSELLNFQFFSHRNVNTQRTVVNDKNISIILQRPYSWVLDIHNIQHIISTIIIKEKKITIFLNTGSTIQCLMGSHAGRPHIETQMCVHFLERIV